MKTLFCSLKMPKLIHFIWIGSKIPLKYVLNIINVAINNLNFVIIVWFDHNNRFLNCDDVLTSIPKNIIIKNISLLFPKIIKKLPSISNLEIFYKRECIGIFANFAAGADILRLLILYLYGGIYLDVDIKTKSLFCPLVLDNDKFYIHISSEKRQIINNDLIACSKNCLLIKKIILEMQSRYLNENSEVLWKLKRQNENLEKLNSLITKVGNEMRKEIIDMKMLDSYYNEIAQINLQRINGRFSKTMYLSSPQLIQDVLKNESFIAFPIIGFDIGHDCNWIFKSTKKLYSIEI